jgi:integrative and conjugative element protein (TIGR02256 family)
MILKNIKSECIKARDKETGGILFGNYSINGKNAILSSITGPPKDSRRTACRFIIINVTELNAKIDYKWKQGHYYIGEWHFHPHSRPKPSILDDLQMKKNSIDELLKCPEPILLIIGGDQENGWELSLHVYTKDDKVTLIKE